MGDLRRLSAEQRWRVDLVEGVTRGGDTTLRHLSEPAELHVRHGRLVRGGGYGDATLAARQALARTGAILRLRERGRFYVHAAGLVHASGWACLLIGDTGSGKSTLAYALGRAGWGVLGDDGVVLGERGGWTQAYAWRTPLMVSVTLSTHFPELSSRLRDVMPGDVRQRVAVAIPAAPSGPVGALMFVERALDGVPGGLESLGPSLALARLLGQSPWVLLTDMHAQSHFRVLERTTATVPAFKLTHGPAELGRVRDIFESLAVDVSR